MNRFLAITNDQIEKRKRDLANKSAKEAKRLRKLEKRPASESLRDHRAKKSRFNPLGRLIDQASLRSGDSDTRSCSAYLGSFTNTDMAQKGHTRREGETAKAWGKIASNIGLIWSVLAYILTDGTYILLPPVILIFASGLTFFVGLNLAKSR